MYEELVKRLRERAVWINFPHHDEEYPTEDAKLMMDAADAIEELQRQIDAWVEPERKALIKSLPRWIPVTERLPEKRKWVLCKCQAHITDVLRFENAEWYHDPTHVYMYEFVTHWMPLPEPPSSQRV